MEKRYADLMIRVMGYQKKIDETILNKGANYLLAVKYNQPKLYEAIQEVFFEPDEALFNENFSNYSEQTNEEHARLETRRCWVCTNIKELGFDISQCKGLKPIVVIVSERTLGNETTLNY